MTIEVLSFCWYCAKPVLKQSVYVYMKKESFPGTLPAVPLPFVDMRTWICHACNVSWGTAPTHVPSNLSGPLVLDMPKFDNLVQ